MQHLINLELIITNAFNAGMVNEYDPKTTLNNYEYRKRVIPDVTNPPTQQWVKVSETPEVLKQYLCFANFIGENYMAEIVTIGQYQQGYWTTDRDNDADRISIEVTHYMELPYRP